MVRFKVEAVQLHWVAADNHVIQSRQSSLTSLTGSWPAPIWSLSPLRLCSLQSQFCWWLAPCFWKSPGSWTMGSCMSCWSWCAKEQPLPDRLWVARDGVSYHISNDCQHIVRNPADEIWTRTRQGSDNVTTWHLDCAAQSRRLTSGMGHKPPDPLPLCFAASPLGRRPWLPLPAPGFPMVGAAKRLSWSWRSDDLWLLIFI